ncbi:prolyl-tRNA synthetase associated domain-containing protein [Facklamia sp. 7083-14-GEN3]|uniref:prolyl-tRNA synthetase associated domain-containing protein n=1 Tax=Facklamia sp. 7083-14-GEN3 TaxID=2973478 RepID=UPI00215D2CFE|nr:prolyl-tRNA synthetase associated domain-containing protein [Facklamia sp. 7083-14-GEN3]MCR8969612.1 prolyl-tRNA synthetase associated domain-containing protein [Facklamia sp. 7083-14-GEN3]
MDRYQAVEEKLKELGISFQIVDHEPALTTEQADAFIEGIEGVRTKTMFLTNRKKTEFYLLIMNDQKQLDMDQLKELIHANKVRMASAESLKEKMQLSSGVVSPFGLLFNEEKDIKVYFDYEIMGQDRMSFHPNTNEKTIFIETQDLLKFIEAIGFEYEILKF